MKFILEVNNKTSQRFLKKEFKNIFARTVELAGIPCLKSKTLELSIAMVGEDEIQTLNSQYRKKNSPTDVLSFSEYEKIEELCEKSKQDQLFIGELILCPAYIGKNADEDGESFEYAMTYIAAHGILHLLGFGHGKKMFSAQRTVADQLIKTKI